MTVQPKPLAALSSTLLARKGQAKPAMRPQGFGGFGALPVAQDDLGWNDMGDTPEPAPEPDIAETIEERAAPPPPVPPVLIQRKALAEEFAPPAEVAEPVEAAAETPEPEAQPVYPATVARIGRETRAKKAKAAFTLRLDHDRHLRLRLASAVRNRSAQLLVTEALDAFLDTLPEVETLLRQLPPRAGH